MRRCIAFFMILWQGLLSGCGFNEENNVRQWIADERNRSQPKVAPIPAPKQFIPEAYTNATAIDPFSNQKLLQALKNDSSKVAGNAALVAPELIRRKEPLESFPLDAMTMVGSVIKQGQPLALLKVDNLLYSVKVGDHIGQNYGKIVKIEETEVALREIVQDSLGEWAERVAMLTLQERTK